VPPEPAIATSQPDDGFGLLLDRSLGLLAALFLLAMVAVTCVDVVGRYWFDAPLNGAFELNEILLAALVFAALPLATDRREHVDVDLIAGWLKPGHARLTGVLASIFSGALLLTLAWRLWLHAGRLSEDAATTNALEIPLAPIAWGAAISCALSAGIALLRGFRGSAEDIV
jgi:TRAP-type C4-dicarboxylate transport system permease small subunit